MNGAKTSTISRLFTTFITTGFSDISPQRRLKPSACFVDRPALNLLPAIFAETTNPWLSTTLQFTEIILTVFLNSLRRVQRIAVKVDLFFSKLVVVRFAKAF
jgi:hypothetical protein